MKTEKSYRANNQIKLSPIILIDESGQNLGSIPLFKARDLAISKNLDLVEVSPNCKPPICKIMDLRILRNDRILYIIFQTFSLY